MENIASKHAVLTESIFREIEKLESRSMLGQKGICIGLERRYVQLPLAARWDKASDMILTNKALRKGDKSLDLAQVELRFGWGLYNEMLPSNFSLTALF